MNLQKCLQVFLLIHHHRSLIGSINSIFAVPDSTLQQFIFIFVSFYRSNNANNYCVGYDKKYQSCHAQQVSTILNVTDFHLVENWIPADIPIISCLQCNNVPRMTVREFADEICSRARDVDPDLIGTGLQRMESDGTFFACCWIRLWWYLSEKFEFF